MGPGGPAAQEAKSPWRAAGQASDPHRQAARRENWTADMRHGSSGRGTGMLIGNARCWLSHWLNPSLTIDSGLQLSPSPTHEQALGVGDSGRFDFDARELDRGGDRRGGHERPGRQGSGMGRTQAAAGPVGSPCQRARRRGGPGGFRGGLGSGPILFGGRRTHSTAAAAAALSGPASFAAAGVLQAQTTPPDRFARSERMSHEIDRRRVLFVGDQSLDEFPRPHPLTEKRPRLFLEVEVCADFGCGDGLDFLRAVRRS